MYQSREQEDAITRLQSGGMTIMEQTVNADGTVTVLWRYRQASGVRNYNRDGSEF